MGGTEVTYIIKMQDRTTGDWTNIAKVGREPGAPAGAGEPLAKAEIVAEGLHNATGDTYEIHRVETEMIRRWHNPMPKTKPPKGQRWNWNGELGQWDAVSDEFP
jgi:hypothetical protein